MTTSTCGADLDEKDDPMLKNFWIMTAAITTIALIGEDASAREIPLEEGGSFQRVEAPQDPWTRKELVDRALDGQQPREEATPDWGARDLVGLLENVNANDITLAAGDPLEFFANPEPSSLVVWTTSAMGLLAAGYGYRRRWSETPIAVA